MALTNCLLDVEQSHTQLLLDAQQSHSQQLLEAQQLQSRQQAEAQRQQAKAQRQQLDTVQVHAADSLQLHEQLAQERLHAQLAEERLRRIQEVSDLRIQFAEKQEKRQTDIADLPVTEIQSAQKITETPVTKPGQQTDKTVSGTPSTSINAKLPVCSASHTLTTVNENEILIGVAMMIHRSRNFSRLTICQLETMQIRISKTISPREITALLLRM